MAGSRDIILCSSALSGSTLAEIVICKRWAGDMSPGNRTELQLMYYDKLRLELELGWWREPGTSYSAPVLFLDQLWLEL